MSPHARETQLPAGAPVRDESEISLISFRRLSSPEIRFDFLPRASPARVHPQVASPRGANQDRMRYERRDTGGAAPLLERVPRRDSRIFLLIRHDGEACLAAAVWLLLFSAAIVKRPDGSRDRFWENSQRVALFEVGSRAFLSPNPLCTTTRAHK